MTTPAWYAEPIYAIRTERGSLHLAQRNGRNYLTACWRTFATRRDDLVIWRGRTAIGRAWALELRCADCRSLIAKGTEGFNRACAWNG